MRCHQRRRLAQSRLATGTGTGAERALNSTAQHGVRQPPRQLPPDVRRWLRSSGLPDGTLRALCLHHRMARCVWYRLPRSHRVALVDRVVGEHVGARVLLPARPPSAISRQNSTQHMRPHGSAPPRQRCRHRTRAYGLPHLPPGSNHRSGKTVCAQPSPAQR